MGCVYDYYWFVNIRRGKVKFGLMVCKVFLVLFWWWVDNLKYI